MGLPKQGFVNQCYSLHLIYDGVQLGGMAGEGLSQGDVLGTVGFIDNLMGRRSGLQSSALAGAEYGAAVARPQGAPYEDTNSGGTVTYAATTLTDTAKAWAVNGLAGRQIRSVAAGALTTMTVVSNTATVLTGAAWSNGTPGAGALYTVAPIPVGPHVAVVGGNPRPSTEQSDNWYKAQMELGNAEVV